MREERFEVPVAGGVLAGHRGGDGPPALLLHGGPAVADYTEGCAAELSGVFETIRYTQRGVPPSVAAPPYTIEAHMADALAVLDFFGLDRAWAIGHSWGGPRTSIETAALIPGAKVDLIEDCGHFPWLERPGELLRAYQLFQ